MVRAYTNIYYKTDADLKADKELKAWQAGLEVEIVVLFASSCASMSKVCVFVILLHMANM